MTEIVAVLSTLLFCSIVFAQETKRFVKVNLSDHKHVYELGKLGITILDAGEFRTQDKILLVR